MIRTTPIYVTWISAGNILPGFFFEAKESHESLLGVDGRRKVLEHGVAAIARDGCRQERERERDRQPPSDPFSKNKETMDEG